MPDRRTLGEVEKPRLVEKKMSTEKRYVKRFIRIDIALQEFQWGRNVNDFSNGKYKRMNISRLCKGVVMSEATPGPNFSLLIHEVAALPEDVWVKSFFHPSPPTSIDVKFSPGHGNVTLEAYMEVLSWLAP